MKQVFTLLLVFFSLTVFSQKEFQGKATYMSKTTVDLNAWGGDQMSEQRKKQIMERMKNFLEKTYTLNFNQTESNFKENAKLDTPGAGRGRGFRFGGSAGGSVYKNTKDGKVIESSEFFGKKFLITDKSGQPQWELGTESKKIGQYTCYKATLVKEDNEFDWTSFRRRGRRNNDKGKDSVKTKEVEKKKTVLVTAWYTPEIPVSTGPDDYWGLPGLILEINAGRTTMLCTEIVLNPEEKVEIKAPKKGDKVTREEYNAIIKKKTEEMQERFRSRGGGRGRGRF